MSNADDFLMAQLDDYLETLRAYGAQRAVRECERCGQAMGEMSGADWEFADRHCDQCVCEDCETGK